MTGAHGGCQPGLTKGASVPGPCRVGCLHRGIVRDYLEAKAAADEARKIARELATHGFHTEAADWDAANPALTFKAYLLANATNHRREAA